MHIGQRTSKALSTRRSLIDPARHLQVTFSPIKRARDRSSCYRYAYLNCRDWCRGIMRGGKVWGYELDEENCDIGCWFDANATLV